jgi:hypothetical protein
MTPRPILILHCWFQALKAKLLFCFTNNLLFGTTYYWRIRARNSSDTTAWSTYGILPYSTVPSPDNSIQRSNQSESQCDIFWNWLTEFITMIINTTPLPTLTLLC